MRVLAMISMTGLLVASACFAQEQAPDSQQVPAAPATTPATSQNQKQTIVVPAGTHIPLSLTNPIHTREVHPGDAVRLVTAFPVTVDTQLAIPAGTYVEGVIQKVIKHVSRNEAQLQMHFTRLVFATGYNLALDGVTMQASLKSPDVTISSAASSTSDTAESGFASTTPATTTFQQLPGQPPPPTAPPTPHVGPNMGAIIGATFGVTAAVIVGGIISGRHRRDFFFDAGTQFDMVLQSSLSLDAQSIVAQNQ